MSKIKEIMGEGGELIILPSKFSDMKKFLQKNDIKEMLVTGLVGITIAWGATVGMNFDQFSPIQITNPTVASVVLDNNPNNDGSMKLGASSKSANLENEIKSPVANVDSSKTTSGPKDVFGNLLNENTFQLTPENVAKSNLPERQKEALNIIAVAAQENGFNYTLNINKNQDVSNVGVHGKHLKVSHPLLAGKFNPPKEYGAANSYAGHSNEGSNSELPVGTDGIITIGDASQMPQMAYAATLHEGMHALGITIGGDYANKNPDGNIMDSYYVSYMKENYADLGTVAILAKQAAEAKTPEAAQFYKSTADNLFLNRIANPSDSDHYTALDLDRAIDYYFNPATSEMLKSTSVDKLAEIIFKDQTERGFSLSKEDYNRLQVSINQAGCGFNGSYGAEHKLNDPIIQYLVMSTTVDQYHTVINMSDYQIDDNYQTARNHNLKADDCVTLSSEAMAQKMGMSKEEAAKAENGDYHFSKVQLKDDFLVRLQQFRERAQEKSNTYKF